MQSKRRREKSRLFHVRMVARLHVRNSGFSRSPSMSKCTEREDAACSMITGVRYGILVHPQVKRCTLEPLCVAHVLNVLFIFLFW